MNQERRPEKERLTEKEKATTNPIKFGYGSYIHAKVSQDSDQLHTKELLASAFSITPLPPKNP